jgi:hypothetical protein
VRDPVHSGVTIGETPVVLIVATSNDDANRDSARGKGTQDEFISSP